MRDIYVDCEMFVVLFTACDPNCDDKGCDKEGPGKCDKYCKSGYILSKEDECLGKWKWCFVEFTMQTMG